MKMTAVLIVLGVPLLLWIAWGSYVIITTERPPYDVIERLENRVEIRQYESQTWITTSYQSDNASFPVLASYIFGRNKERQNIAMTAPVITDRQMAFILPAGVDAYNAPEPDGQAIDFIEVPARKVATFSFSWFASQARIEQKTTELLEVLRANGIATSGEPFLMRYNDPMTPPFLRRNEIAVEVD